MDQKKLQLTGGNDKNDRRALDHYPTPKDVTIALMEFLKQNDRLPLSVWECACGNGAMANIIKEYCQDVYSSDIIDYGYGDRLDYLTTNLEKKYDAIITNPPFNLSEDFIVKAIKESKMTALLLKSQYWHAAKRYNLFSNNKPSYILPLTWRPDFLEHEKKQGDKKGAPTMEVLWTIWIRGNYDTKYIPLIKPNNNAKLS